MKIVERYGWGRTSSVKSFSGDVSEFLNKETTIHSNSGLPIGLGRSYGDSSLNSNGIHWSTATQKEIKIDRDLGIAECGSGITIGELERSCLEFGFFPPVVPGTEFVTIGGAIASDIHGKSHHTLGSFGTNLLSLEVIDSNREVHVLKPSDETKERFWATIGGMGLTGIILGARIKLLPVQSSYFMVEEERSENLQGLLETLERFDRKFMYTVAWIDLSGEFAGRGIVSGGNHANLDELSSNSYSQQFKVLNKRSLSLPNIFPSFTINRVTVKIFNSLWYRKPLKQGIKTARAFLHPLDSIKNWNRLFGKQGIIQYQVQVPFGEESFLIDLINEMKNIGAYSFLGVLKRLGSEQGGILSFPSSGWTLAIDIPAGINGLFESLEELDEKLCLIGGKVYLTKDARLSRAHFEKMYPQFLHWIKIKKEMDPSNYWQSDQGRRLGIC